ncbi:restriction endonuclease subunit S, partial [Glaesserella parasuis]|nr:restriction endonuclease subunit S [Glaesserella parasuis]
MKFKQYEFSDIAEYITTKVDIANVEQAKYISTDNMLANFGGISIAGNLPATVRCNSFKKRDILFSNIRTYFKKVWLAEFDGGCSADVLVIRSKNEEIVLNEFLYLLICSEEFINFTVASSNGAKMPRGDKNAIKKYVFNIPDIKYQKQCIDKYFNLNKKIQLNTQINQTLEQIAQTIFKSWFIDFDPIHAKANALANGQTAEQATQAAMAVISGKNTQELHRLQTANPKQYQQLWEIAEAFPSGFSGYKNLGEIPIGWNVLTFKDFISESKEKVGSLEDVPEYSVGNEGIYPRSEIYNKSLSKTPEKNKVVRIGDLVFGMGSKTLNWGIMNDEIGSVSPAYFVYRIFTNINYIYLNKYIKAKEYDFQNLIKPTSRQGQSVDKEMF